MRQISIISLVFLTSYVSQSSGQLPPSSPPAGTVHPFLVMRSYIDQDSLNADVEAAVNRIIGHQSTGGKAFDSEKQAQLRSIFETLKELPGKTTDEATKIFGKFINDMNTFYRPLNEHVLQENAGECSKDISVDPAEYQDVLDSYDKQTLKKFSKIVAPESEILLVCNVRYISLFINQEKTNFDKASSSVLRCVMNLMILDMAKEMKMFSEEMALSITKSIKLVLPEAASMVFTEKKITGEYLALPLMLVEKMLQIIPRRHFADMQLTLKKPTDPSTIKSHVVSFLNQSNVGIETVLGSVVKLFIKYYESLGPDVFCQLKTKVEDEFSEHSMSALAFGASNKFSCIKK